MKRRGATITESTGKMRPWFLAGALTIIAVAAVLRLIPLDDRAFWYDETFTWKDSRSSYREILMWEHHNRHPPLQYLLVKATTDVLGTDEEWAVRLPSFTASVVAVGLAILLGWRVSGPWAGLALGAFAALHPELLYQGQQARMYSLLLMFFLLFLLGLCSLVDKRSVRGGVGFVLGGVGMVYTSLLGFLLLGVSIMVVAGWLIHTRMRQRRWNRPLLWSLIGVTLLAAVLTLPQFLNAPDLSDAGPAKDMDRDLLYSLRMSISTLYRIVPSKWVGLILCGAGGIALLPLLRRRPLIASLLIAVLLANAVAAFVTLFHAGWLMTPRYVLPFHLVILIGLALLVSALARQSPPAGAAGALLICGTLVWAQLQWPLAHAKTAWVRDHAERVHDGDELLFIPSYYGRSGEYYIAEPTYGYPDLEQPIEPRPCPPGRASWIFLLTQQIEEAQWDQIEAWVRAAHPSEVDKLHAARAAADSLDYDDALALRLSEQGLEVILMDHDDYPYGRR